MTDSRQHEAELHRQALEAYLATAAAISGERWNAPLATGKWSPAQVTEHLRLSYAAIRRELAGGPGFRIVTSWWQRQLVRLLYLPRILSSGRFPAGIRAPREIRPPEGEYSQADLLASLRTEGEELLAAVVVTPLRTSVTHPFAGRLGIIDGIRLATQHLRHHHRQIAPAAEVT